MNALIFYIALTLVVSFFCSLLEAMLLSITPTYVAAAEAENPEYGKRLADLKRDIDKPLSAILALNTVSHTAGASGVGAQVLILFGDAWLTISSFILTLAILYLSEILPKTLGAKYWRQMAPMASRFLPFLITVTYPIVFPAKLMTRLLGKTEEQAFSREEFSAMANIAAEGGMFHEKESVILRNLGRFSSLLAKDIMTPRTVMQALDQDLTVDEVMETDIVDFRFTRIPVYNQEIDDITGFIHKHDLLLKYARDEGATKLSEFKRTIAFVPVSARLPDLFEQMLARKDHVALLVDEYGGTAGIATMEDVVETLIGMEIQDELDEVEDMRQLARQQWRKRARALGIITEDSTAEEVAEDAAQDLADAEAADAEKPKD